MDFADPFSIPSSNPNSDRLLPARFYLEPVPNKAESEKQGRPIYDDVEMINIMRPADPTTDVHQVATAKHKRLYPNEYATFKQRGENMHSGTPLTQLTFLTPRQIREFNAMDIFNVETLASLSDATPFMGWRDLKNKAVAYLALAKDQAVITKWEEEKAAMAARAEAQDQKIGALTDQVAQLIAKLNDPSEKLKPGKLSLPPKDAA